MADVGDRENRRLNRLPRKSDVPLPMFFEQREAEREHDLFNQAPDFLRWKGGNPLGRTLSLSRAHTLAPLWFSLVTSSLSLLTQSCEL